MYLMEAFELTLSILLSSLVFSTKYSSLIKLAKYHFSMKSKVTIHPKLNIVLKNPPISVIQFIDEYMDPSYNVYLLSILIFAQRRSLSPKYPYSANFDVSERTQVNLIKLGFQNGRKDWYILASDYVTQILLIILLSILIG